MALERDISVGVYVCVYSNGIGRGYIGRRCKATIE